MSTAIALRVIWVKRQVLHGPLCVQIANDAFVERISQHYRIKRVPKNKLHPEYRNDFVELFTGRPLKKKGGGDA